MLWESYSTWAASSGGQPTPGSGSAVVLPANTRVMITGCSFRGSGSNVFASIRIPASSELIFDDAQINLVVGAIYVYGRLRAGGEGCRVGAPISITFQPSAGVPESDLGIQVLQGGLLDLHGAAYYPTWTRLAATVQRGNNWLSLQDWVPWRPGQLLFVATSIYRDEYENQNEVAAVQSVSPDGRTIVVDRPFQYSHYGGPEYQTEVGLLSRSILLQSWPGSGATSRGAHVRIMGQGRLEGVLSYRMGQLNMLGAYPIHWHNAGDAGGGVSYAKDCAVYASYYRCFVVHGTNNLVLSDNVAFHATGSCFYLEDGVEEGNWLQHNLGAFVHVIGYPAGGVTQSGEVFVQGPGLAHPADAAAGVFYAANPNNAFKDNAASGGFAGFNFPVLPEPIGDHRWMRSTLNPSKRPLRLFDGNTAHSSGYFWLMAGSIYVGGKLWIDDADGGKLYYSNGRYEMDTRDDTGTALAFHSFTRNRVWLGQWGISHWGARVRVRDWEAHDCVRGANIFGLAQLADAVVNGRSGNVDAQYPAGDHDPIAGFRWYDTRVMTVLTNVTFQNYVYQPNLGVGRQSVWFSMVHSDEYKPAYISASRAITYRNIDGRALVNNPPVATGAGRYFNWIDTDGTATLRGRPTLVGSWPTWWNLGPDCTYQPLGNVYWCDYLPWRAVARLEVRVPGYTVPVDTGNAFSPDPAYYLGYVAQFGHRGSDTRNMTVTRNEGITGVSGSGGWYLHMDAGCTQNLQVFMTQIPPGNSLVFATRYPQGSTFSVSREFRWYTSLSSPVTQAGSLAEVLGGGGDLYWFSGKHLYIKMVDPGDGSVDPPFSVDGVTVWGTRYYSAWYWINVTSMGGQDPWTCPWVAGGTAAAPGARFCPMVADPATDIPDALPSYYNSWVDPFCTDVAPPGSGGGGGTNLLTCIQVVAQGLCSTDAVRRPTDPHVRVLGGYCAVSCGLCNQGDRACVDKVPPGGLTCTQRRATGNCASDWFKSGAWCAATCGFCTPVEPLPPLPPAPTCSDKAVPPGTYSCLQQLQWGQCTQPWMKANGWCLATCGLCAGQQQQQQQQPSTPAGCVDVTPPGGYTCAQQAAWGKCSADFMRSNNYCAATCNNCGTSGGGCGDIAPPGDYTCAQQASWGRCNEGFMLPYGYCAVTCRRCTGGGNCYDVQPSPEYSCAQQASWGKCGDPQLMPKGFCATTCGRCGSGTFAAAWDGEDDSGGGGSDRFISPYAAGVAAGGAASDRSDGAAVVNGSGNAAANAVTGVSSVKPTTADGGGGGGADQAVGPMAEDATAAPGGSAFLINPLGVASPFTVARPSGAAAASVLLYGTNSSYGPYQTAHHVASAASLSDPAYALDSAAASPAGTAADSVVASGGGGVGATKAGGAMTVTFISPGAGSAAAPAITAASEEDVSPTSDRAFNPFENTTSIPSPGSPLGAPKPGFYFAWLRAAVTAAAATDGAAFIAASEGGTDDSGSRGGSDVQMGGAVGYRSFLGLPVTTFGFINSTDLASSLLITNTSGAGASGFSAAESEKAQGTAMASLPVCPLCTDVPPAGGRLSCSELVTAGGCNADWAVAGHVCDGSCGRCTYVEPCIDVRPSGINESCQAARDAGHCSAGGLLAAAGWCRQTCGQCSGASGNSTAGAAIEERRRGDITNGVVLNSTGGSDGGDDCWVMSQCVDLPPPGSQGCDDAVRSGQCSSVWFSSQGYCVKSCGRCVA
ncbi:hypothetical protein PLESTF_000985100 [Pleodorina starrii]|nr:hypothetical protein PLESTF_000985100 [Pleodorina starrii]